MNASAPFKSKAPRLARIIGISHKAFGLDFINPPFSAKHGCLDVSPSSPLNTTGFHGGPWSTSEVNYTLTNVGGDNLNWTCAAASVVGWLVTDTPGGILTPGQTVVVTVSVTAAAESLAVGSYSGSVTFTNTTNHCGDVVIPASLLISNSIALTVQYRRQGGTATLIGFPEYGTPSSPPDMYLQRALSGSSNFNHYPNTTCTSADCTELFVYGGTCSYDAATGVLTTGGTKIISGTCSGWVPGVVNVCTVGAVTAIFGEYETLTTTTRRVQSTFTCFVSGGESANESVCDKLETISVKDTEANAISRLLGSTSFGGYATASAQGDAKSEYQQRTTTIDFAYQVCEYKLLGTGLTPSHLYNGSCGIYRRLWGSGGAWSLVSTTVVSGTTDLAGNFTFGPIALPNAAGYEYTIWNAAVVP